MSTVSFMNAEVPSGFERVARIYLESTAVLFDSTGKLGILQLPEWSAAIDQLKAAESVVKQNYNTTDFAFQAYLSELRANALRRLSEHFDTPYE